MYYGLDISKHQITYNPVIAKAAGIDHVLMRDAYSTSKDIKFDEFASAAVSVGQTVGAYGFATWHYLSNNGGSYDTAVALADKQTAAWLDYAKDKQIDGYFVIDQELEGGKVMGLNQAQNEAILNRCIAAIKAAGYVPLVYCSASWAMTQFNWENVDADLWLAYYYADPADPDFTDVPDYRSKTGKYFAFMQSLGDKLAGWQFGRIGYGEKYGVGSANVDRNVWYKYAEPPIEHEPLSTSPVYITMGFASMGDLLTIEQKLVYLAIPYEEKDGYIYTTVPVSAGDQKTLVALCGGLGIPCVIYDGDIDVDVPDEEPEAEPEVAPEVEKEQDEIVPETESAPEDESVEDNIIPDDLFEEEEDNNSVVETNNFIDKILKAIFEWLTKYFNK